MAVQVAQWREKRGMPRLMPHPCSLLSFLSFVFLLCTSSLLRLCFLHYVVIIFINPCYSSFQTHQLWILHLFHWHHLWITDFFISLSFLYRSIIETQHQLQREKNLWKADKTGLDIRRRPPQISKFPHPPHHSNGPLFSFPGIHKTTRFPCLTQHMYPFGTRGLEAANTEFRELGSIF